MNFNEFDFRPYDAERSDLSCADGEVEGWGGSAKPHFKRELVLERGHLIAVHQYRAIVYTDGKILWADVDPFRDWIGIDDLHPIMELVHPVIPDALAWIGDTLLIDAGKKIYLHWTGSCYEPLEQLPGPREEPKVEFGLMKAGEMADKCSITIPASLVPSAGGSGMSDPHPSANVSGSGDYSKYIDNVVEMLIGEAHADKRSRGYFTAPFFARAVVRDHSGNCLSMSPPALMAVGVLPPCMEVNYTAKENGEATMYSQIRGSGYFSLVARASAIPEEWKTVIKCIDIYVSPQIESYQSGSGFMCSYASLLGGVNGGGHRGRTADSISRLFTGHYSDDGVNFIDHFADPALGDTSVWYVAPNTSLVSDLTSECRFFRVASIDFDQLVNMSEFQSLPIQSTLTARLETFHRLGDEPESVAIHPETVGQLNGCLVAAGGHREAVRPAHPSVMAAHSGNVSATPEEVTVSVYTRDGGRMRRLSVTSECASDIAGSFPRYIYHPDGDATLMTIETGGKLYSLEFTPHPRMPGVYWFGGFGEDYMPQPRADPLPEAIEDPIIPCPDRLWLSSPGSLHHFPKARSITACNGAIRAVCASVVTADISAVGKFPVYVFADDGVWLVEYDSDRQRFCGSYRISSEVCASARSVVFTDDGVVFATSHSLMRASGAKVKRLMPLRGLSDLSVSSLMLAYDGALSSLIITDSASGTTHICDMLTLACSEWSEKVKSLPLTRGRPLIQTSAGDVGYLSLEASDGVVIKLMTRPIKLSKTFTPKIIRSVTVWHDSTPDSIAVNVYAANSFADWHLIAASDCHRAEIAARSPWRFVRIEVTVKSGVAETPRLYGAQIEWCEF